MHLTAVLQRPALASAGEVPEPHGAFMAAGDQSLAVWRHQHVVHDLRVCIRLGDPIAAGGEVPVTQGRRASIHRDRLAIRRERNRITFADAGLDGVDLSQRHGIPDGQLTGEVDNGQVLVVGRKSDRVWSEERQRFRSTRRDVPLGDRHGRAAGEECPVRREFQLMRDEIAGGNAPNIVLETKINDGDSKFHVRVPSHGRESVARRREDHRSRARKRQLEPR